MMNDLTYRSLVAARVKLLFENRSVGQPLARLILEDASRWCDTIATDGRYLFYNCGFVAGLSKGDLGSLLSDFAVTDPPGEGSDVE